MFPWKSTILSLCAMAVPLIAVFFLGIDRGKVDAALSFMERKRRILWTLWVVAFLLLNAIPLAILGLPIASVHDELSYILGADTFAHGRLTNPPLPSWENFETLYVQQQPTYASIYPPGSALTLAAGQVATGHPYWGLFFLNALLAALLPWAFCAWVSFPYAWAATLIWGGGIICTYWTHGYWGGTLAALLGTLSLGALGRCLRPQAIGYCLLLGFSLGALAFVRPFEGLFLATGLLSYLFWKERQLARWVSLLAPLLACLALWCYYNYRVTGKPFLHPYFLYFSTYIGKPFLWGQVEREVVYRHQEIELMLSPLGEGSNLLPQVVWKVFLFFFPLRPIVSVVLLFGGLGAVITQRRTPILIALFAAISATALSRYGFPHYVAPYFAFLGLVLAFGIQWVNSLDWRKIPIGSAVAIGLVVASWAGTGEAFVNMLRGQRDLRLLTVLFPRLEYPPYSLNISEENYAMAKLKVTARLLEAGAKHLVFVQYRKTHNPHMEWVYNGADLEEQPIIWARFYTKESRSQLRQRFADRACWVVEADQVPPALGPCSD